MGREERRKREKQRRRNAILKAARKLFFGKGFRAVTVDSIAAKAELSKGAIYLHFKSKEEIYTHILLRDIQKFHDTVEDLLGDKAEATGTILRLAEIYTDFFHDEPELFRILMTFMLQTEHMNLPEDLRVHLIAAATQTMDVVEDALVRGIRSGVFASTVNPKQCRNVIWGMLNGIISLYLFVGKETKRYERIRSDISAGLTSYLAGLAPASE